jgi:hypothetical protein
LQLQRQTQPGQPTCMNKWKIVVIQGEKSYIL